MVKAGAVLSVENHLPNQQGQGGVASLRQELIDKGIVVDREFKEDHEFSSTSAAAAVLLGTASQWPVKWLKDGKTLKEIMSQ